jgi:hypothetical protein
LITFRRGKIFTSDLTVFRLSLQPIVLWEIGYRSWIQRIK